VENTAAVSYQRVRDDARGHLLRILSFLVEIIPQHLDMTGVPMMSQHKIKSFSTRRLIMHTSIDETVGPYG